MMAEETKPILKEYLNGKNVLDIGCVGIDTLYLTHEWLRENAGCVTGIDNNYEGIKAMLDKGYDVLYANAEDFFLDSDYDVVVALEVVEHLGSPGLFLENVKKHMHKNSVFILTVPNCFCFASVVKNKESEWHLQSYNEHTIRQLLEFYGYSVVDIKYVGRGFDWKNLSWNPLRTFYRVVGSVLNRFFPRSRERLFIIAKPKGARRWALL